MLLNNAECRCLQLRGPQAEDLHGVWWLLDSKGRYSRLGSSGVSWVLFWRAFTYLVDSALLVSDLFDGFAQHENVVNTQGCDTGYQRLRYYISRVVGPAYTYFENGRIDLFLQEDVESHSSKIAEIGWLVRRVLEEPLHVALAK